MFSKMLNLYNICPKKLLNMNKIDNKNNNICVFIKEPGA